MKTLKWVMIAMILITSIASAKYIIKLRKENSRLSVNNEALVLNGTQKDGTVRTLKLTVDDLRNHLAADSTMKRLLRDSLQFKEKHIRRLTKSTSTTTVAAETILKDGTIAINDTIYPVKMFHWSDPWTDISGIIERHDKIKIHTESRDTILYGAANKKYGKWFFARWFEKPKIVIKVANTNPHSNIVIQFDAEMVK